MSKLKSEILIETFSYRVTAEEIEQSLTTATTNDENTPK
jgi:hypothetical protein